MGWDPLTVFCGGRATRRDTVPGSPSMYERLLPQLGAAGLQLEKGRYGGEGYGPLLNAPKLYGAGAAAQE